MKPGNALFASHLVLAVSIACFTHSLWTYVRLAELALPAIQAVRPLCEVAPAACDGGASSPAAQDARQMHRFWSAQVRAHLDFARLQVVAWAVVLLASLCVVIVLHRARRPASRAPGAR